MTLNIHEGALCLSTQVPVCRGTEREGDHPRPTGLLTCELSLQHVGAFQESAEDATVWPWECHNLTGAHERESPFGAWEMSEVPQSVGIAQATVLLKLEECRWETAQQPESIDSPDDAAGVSTDGRTDIKWEAPDEVPCCPWEWDLYPMKEDRAPTGDMKHDVDGVREVGTDRAGAGHGPGMIEESSEYGVAKAHENSVESIKESLRGV